MQTSIPITDLGDIAIIKSTDDESAIQQKINGLHNNMLNQINLLKQWHQQGGILTQEQADKLLSSQPMITAYLTRFT
ncbi:hypothetical protein A6046_00930 [[Haemophilus] ducreyi]|uniref:Uncharacterized protein n=2 Tax=Haemophilus ducreyi TaxID=730 RepID=Q7VML7_HAEDU|nr:hypothetical protein [[Haemophilus] ducreyi]AAP95839.1 hypothetical protein HD_0958 [[Haemophilus] ducreyi 35000HP]AKO30867.1 hypothetical protein RY60_03780 [[Haemophilus] ducreyi]AKO32305.1 hypothetical protein RZ57_03785 [[Haemophilus] ducreyi]AKO33759.1 hypothetical protein RZ58_03800 [[Haemophilus] ducreyi]AKO35207.1 hypothetical protein RZ59_03765 [[Haemophilus] ducreyi]